jgi:hypothetical protein
MIHYLRTYISVFFRMRRDNKICMLYDNVGEEIDALQNQKPFVLILKSQEGTA